MHCAGCGRVRLHMHVDDTRHTSVNKLNTGRLEWPMPTYIWNWIFEMEIEIYCERLSCGRRQNTLRQISKLVAEKEGKNSDFWSLVNTAAQKYTKSIQEPINVRRNPLRREEKVECGEHRRSLSLFIWIFIINYTLASIWNCLRQPEINLNVIFRRRNCAENSRFRFDRVSLHACLHLLFYLYFDVHIDDATKSFILFKRRTCSREHMITSTTAMLHAPQEMIETQNLTMLKFDYRNSVLHETERFGTHSLSPPSVSFFKWN